MDFSFDFSPSYDISFDFAPNMSVGTAGYYTPPADFSGGTSQMSYAGGQSYAGDSGEWGASGAYCADSYSSYMSAQYGALGQTIAAQQLNVFQNPVSSWYPDDSSLAYAQNACLALATGCVIAATYGAAATAGPGIYSTLSGFGTTAATSPELVAAGAGAAQYGVQNAPELESLAPETSSVVAEGGASLETAIQPYWPANNGIQGVANNIELQVGTLLDRYGLGTGTFAAPAGTPFEMRSLPLEALQSPYNIYQVVQPFNANAGPTAPAFGQLGQGIQY